MATLKTWHAQVIPATRLTHSLIITEHSANQLQYVQDNASVAANKAKGFVDGHTGTTTDYTYDVNGNMTRDLNKGIGNTISDASNLITTIFESARCRNQGRQQCAIHLYSRRTKTCAGSDNVNTTNRPTMWERTCMKTMYCSSSTTKKENGDERHNTTVHNSFSTVTADITTVNSTAAATPAQTEKPT